VLVRRLRLVLLACLFLRWACCRALLLTFARVPLRALLLLALLLFLSLLVLMLLLLTGLLLALLPHLLLVALLRRLARLLLLALALRLGFLLMDALLRLARTGLLLLRLLGGVALLARLLVAVAVLLDAVLLLRTAGALGLGRFGLRGLRALRRRGVITTSLAFGVARFDRHALAHLCIARLVGVALLANRDLLARPGIALPSSTGDREACPWSPGYRSRALLLQNYGVAIAAASIQT